MSNEIKQGDKVRVSENAPSEIIKNEGIPTAREFTVTTLGGYYAEIKLKGTLLPTYFCIPTKYLVKVDAEAFRLADVVSDAGLHQDNYLNEDKKEPKCHKGDRVKFKNIYELQKVKDKSFRWMLVMFASKEATITAVEDNGFYRVDIDPSIGGINDDMIECKVEPTEQTETEGERVVTPYGYGVVGKDIEGRIAVVLENGGFCGIDKAIKIIADKTDFDWVHTPPTSQKRLH